MSLSTKLSSVRRIVQELRKWPEDSHKIYNSFREAQISRYEETLIGSPARLPSAEGIDKQAMATRLLFDEKNSCNVSRDSVVGSGGLIVVSGIRQA
jgi:hypothetical protein